MNQQNKKFLSPEAIRKKIEYYCAYQERCQQEVRNKLFELGAYSKDVEQIIVELIEKNFLNEERFAKAFAGGKFRIKKWGRVKIINELKFRQISSYCIKQALKQIDEDDYLKTLSEVIEKKKPNEKKLSNMAKMKLAQFAIQKGFESDLVWKHINKDAR